VYDCVDPKPERGRDGIIFCGMNQSDDPHMTDRRVEIQARRRIFDDFFAIDEAILRYERFDGTMSEPVRRLCLDRGDSVAAIVLNRDRNTVLLVDQFKFPTYKHGRGWVLETVAGMIDGDEEPEAAMRREVREEIGYELTHVERIATFYVSPGGTSERVVLFYGEVEEASRYGPGGGVAAEGEDIAIREFSLDELWTALDSGQLEDAKTIVGAMWLRNRCSPR
jgi:ADP-ribose pyrophosphatase